MDPTEKLVNNQRIPTSWKCPRPVPTAASMSYAMSVRAVPMANPCRRTTGWSGVPGGFTGVYGNVKGKMEGLWISHI